MGQFIGQFEDIEIVGFKTTFSMLYGENQNGYFVNVEKGIGINKESKLEGIKQNNFFGTYLIGPILIMNPLFTKYIIKLMGIEEPKLKFEDDVISAYETRLEEFKGPKVK